MSGLWVRRQERFEGLVERCAPGGHRGLAEIIQGLGLSPESKVLDVAAGSGAFLARLRAQGFRDLSAIELDVADFKLSGIPVKSVDLNRPFAEQFDQRFDLITAVEIIEHLDNPRHLLKELHSLLKPGGTLVVTVPNTEQWIARLKFLIKGEPKHFGLADIESQRHISPILSFQMEYMFREIGYQLQRLTSVGNFWGTFKDPLFTLLGKVVKLFIRGCRLDGEMLVFVAKAGEPAASLKGRDSRYFEAANYALADDKL